MVRVTDLSVPLRTANMESRDVVVVATSHSEAARVFARSHGLRVSDLPGGEFPPTERIALGSHAATHLDAPYHFYPTSEGRPAKRIDEVPLEWLLADAHVLDFRHRGPAEYITEFDVAEQLESLPSPPAPGDIVLGWTGGTDGYDDDPRFGQSAAGMNSGALAVLFDRGIIIAGVDSATMDIPISVMVERFRGGDVSAYFPIHRAGRLKEWTHAEKLGHFADLPGRAGFKVALFPVKISGGTGSWTRAVAIEDPWLDEHAVELVDLTLPIMNASFEPEPSFIATRHHDQARRAKAKELKIPLADVVHASAMDAVDTYTRAGTHLCAPAFFSADRDGEPRLTVDQVPLDWCYGEGLLLDFSGRPGVAPISLEEVRGEVERVGAEPGEGTIVLVSTGAAERFADDPAYADSAPGVAAEAVAWLLDRGVRVVGIDAESLDGPVEPMVDALRAGRPAEFFPVQQLGRERDLCVVNKLDLRGLVGRAPSGFKVSVFPIKIEGVSAAWTRAVALFPRTGDV